MTGVKNNKLIPIIFIVMSLFLFYPNKVSAKNTLVTCNYLSSDVTMIKLTIYDDYSAKGTISKFKGKNMGFLESGKTVLQNWSLETKEEAKKKNKKDICPPHVTIQYSKTLKNLWTFYDADKANKHISELKILSKKVDIAKLDTITDSSGKTTNADNSGERITKDKNYSKCKSFLGDPTKETSVAWLLQKLFNYIKVLGPILVILLSSLDFTRTILASDEETMKKAQKKLGVRLMCAVGIYFLPMLITLMINIVFGTADANAICGIK